MKRLLAFLLCLMLLSGLAGCALMDGEMQETGIFVRTQEGLPVFICEPRQDGTQYILLLDEWGDECKSTENLQTGDKLTVTLPTVPYEEEGLTEIYLIKWRKHWFGHTEVSQETLDNIESLVADHKAQ